MPKFHTVAFDLDGTLSNPTRGLVSAIKYGFDKMGLPKSSDESLKKYIGPPLRESFERDYSLTSKESEECVRLFREYFSVYGWWDNEIYEGVRDLLACLKKKGKKIILATSKPQIFAEKILKLFEIEEYFDFIGAATLDKRRETKEQVLNFALLETGIDEKTKSGVILVGDTKFDVEGARLCGISSLGVLWGFGKRSELEAEGADYIAENIEEAKKILLF